MSTKNKQRLSFGDDDDLNPYMEGFNQLELRSAEEIALFTIDEVTDAIIQYFPLFSAALFYFEFLSTTDLEMKMKKKKKDIFASLVQSRVGTF